MQQLEEMLGSAGRDAALGEGQLMALDDAVAFAKALRT